jgi:predicted O-linked N-acetylglucosamine transferase (SPINDLY family)
MSAYNTLSSALAQHPDHEPLLRQILACCIQLGKSEAGYRHAADLLALGVQDIPVLQAMLVFSRQMGDLPTAWRTLMQLENRQADPRVATVERILLGRQLCDWNTWQEDLRWLGQHLNERTPGLINPHLLITYEEFTPAEILDCATAFTQTLSDAKHPPLRKPLPLCRPGPACPIDSQPSSATDIRIEATKKKHRIGFVCADFGAHATTYLILEFLQCRDRLRFETHLYLTQPGRMDDTWLNASKAACEQFDDLSGMTDKQAAEQIAQHGVDILIDLQGFSRGSRLGILAHRPAPRILSWLTYPGTLGHALLADGILGDRVVTPACDAAYYSEAILHLPFCYQANPGWSEHRSGLERSQVGLPANALVFGSFNQSYKITPQTFSRWCALIGRVSGSVLWLLDPGQQQTRDNLLAVWRAHGLKADHLIWAPRSDMQVHMTRLPLVDIALDTFPYTSHTTGCDALAVGVPLVAKTGKTFASRVSASLLTNLGLTELIVDNDADWLHVNLSLAHNPGARQALRVRLLDAVRSGPLFSPQLFADAFYAKCTELITGTASRLG